MTVHWRNCVTCYSIDRPWTSNRVTKRSRQLIRITHLSLLRTVYQIGSQCLKISNPCQTTSEVWIRTNRIRLGMQHLLEMLHPFNQFHLEWTHLIHQTMPYKILNMNLQLGSGRLHQTPLLRKHRGRKIHPNNNSRRQRKTCTSSGLRSAAIGEKVRPSQVSYIIPISESRIALTRHIWSLFIIIITIFYNALLKIGQRKWRVRKQVQLWENQLTCSGCRQHKPNPIKC